MRKFPITLNQSKRFSDWPSTELLVVLVISQAVEGPGLWHPRQSHVGQRRLVLVVSEVCSQE